MNFSENIRSSFHNIWNHKVRTSLTLIGITIGVMAVIMMFSTIHGIKNLISQNMEGMGWDNSLMIHPSSGGGNNRNRRHGFRSINREAKPLTRSDYMALKGLDNVKSIYGIIENWERNRKGSARDYTKLRATNISFFENKTFDLQRGRFFNAFEESNAAKVCIIGYYYAETNYKNKSPIGQNLVLGDKSFRIIGVLAEDSLNRGKGFNFNPWERKRDLEAVYIPLSTGAKYLRLNNAVDYIYVQADSDENFQKLKTSVTQHLLAKHNMAHDFGFQDVGSMMLKISTEMEGMMKKWSVTLMSIAGISLFVGGIGLFSTLLISINERMMEIGIRKSLGATERDVFGLFLFESLILSIIASIQGIVISMLILFIVSKSIDFSFAIPSQGILIGVGFSILIGIISGIYPAFKASRLDPIKAIYYLD
ncbi:MAG: ABC transporter permease [Candidatus Cloacimonetes bacterium]|nr:ABC transporter permease [Candidatus Cloacimonadota bacterium]